MTPSEHPFAPYLRIMARGPRLARALTEAEAEAATRLVLAGAVEPVQLGAFLCLMRVAGETEDELAGMARAARASLVLPAGAPPVDLDWPSYAGKRGRPPWFLLAVLLLAANGVRVFMHGQGEHTAGRLYTLDALAALGLAPARDLGEAAAQLAERHFAFLPLAAISARLSELMTLKPIIGVRSPIHSVVRELDPFGARCAFIGVAHPPYRRLHQGAGLRLGRARLVVFKGDGGEGERRPEKPCDLALVADGRGWEETWEAMPAAPAPPATEPADPLRLRGLWDGSLDDPAAEAAVIATAAVALRALGRAESQGAAEALATSWWNARRRSSFKSAA